MLCNNNFLYNFFLHIYIEWYKDLAESIIKLQQTKVGRQRQKQLSDILKKIEKVSLKCIEKYFYFCSTNSSSRCTASMRLLILSIQRPGTFS